MSSVVMSISDVNTSFLTEILRKNNCLLYGEVTKVRRQPCSQIATSGLVYRLHLSYSSTANISAPSSLIFKLPSMPGDYKERMHWSPYRREVLFYQHFASVHIPFVPRCYDIAWDEQIEQFHLLLEDMLPDSYQIDWQMGFGFSELCQIVDWLATFHATWWNHPDLASWSNDLSPLLNQMTIEKEHENVKRILEIFSDSIDNREKALFYKVIHYWDQLTDMQDDTPLTLCHGDLHPNNIFMPRSMSTSMKVIDWQCFHRGYGISDIADLLSLFLHPYTQKTWNEVLLKRYCSKLLEYHLIYPFEKCYRDYRIEVAKNLLMPLIQTCIPNLHTSAVLHCFRNAVVAFDDNFKGLEDEIFRSFY